MIFEKQDYQQECINNIITLLDGFDFKRHDALNLKDCLSISRRMRNSCQKFKRQAQC